MKSLFVFVSIVICILNSAAFALSADPSLGEDRTLDKQISEPSIYKIGYGQQALLTDVDGNQSQLTIVSPDGQFLWEEIVAKTESPYSPTHIAYTRKRFVDCRPAGTPKGLGCCVGGLWLADAIFCHCSGWKYGSYSGCHPSSLNQ